MTKVIWVFIVVIVVYLGYLLFQNWAKIQSERDGQSGSQQAAVAVNGDSLPGMPQTLEAGYRAAKEKNASALRQWLKTNDKQLQDPRKAWIELELCVMLARENPAEAKTVFAAVKQRTPPSSPVWPRMKELEKTFE